MLPRVLPKGKWKRSARVSSYNHLLREQPALVDEARTHVAGEILVLGQEDIVRVQFAVQRLDEIGNNYLVRQHTRVSWPQREVSPVTHSEIRSPLAHLLKITSQLRAFIYTSKSPVSTLAACSNSANRSRSSAAVGMSLFFSPVAYFATR